jgi:hypothetical protein
LSLNRHGQRSGSVSLFRPPPLHQLPLCSSIVDPTELTQTGPLRHTFTQIQADRAAQTLRAHFGGGGQGCLLQGEGDSDRGGQHPVRRQSGDGEFCLAHLYPLPFRGVRVLVCGIHCACKRGEGGGVEVAPVLPWRALRSSGLHHNPPPTHTSMLVLVPFLTFLFFHRSAVTSTASSST